MRERVDADAVGRLMRALGAAAREEGTCFLAGGATAVLLGWRATTVDVDLQLDPEQDSVLRELPRLKNELRLNVELASPSDFIPLPPGWRERSPSIRREGKLVFRHLDFYSQALAKLERAHRKDLDDVRQLLGRGLVEPDALLSRFDEIEPDLYRFPAIDAGSFRHRVEEATR